MKKLLFGLLLLCYGAQAQQTLFAIEIKGKWGYMNSEGKMMIPAQFDYADDFSEGMAVVAFRNQPCVINENGKRVIDTGSFQFISRFSEGFAAASDYNGQKYIINPKGDKTVTLPADIYEIRAFREGVAVVSKKIDEHETKFGRDIATLGYKFGYVNTKGEPVTDFVYDDADDAKNGIMRVKQGVLFGLLRTDGSVIIKPTYENIGIFTEGKAVVDVKAKFGYINTSGEIVIKPIFDYAYDFTEGVAGVYLKGKYGFIDASGAFQIPATFDLIKPFSEGKAAVLKENKWGFIDKSGNWVLRNVFDNAAVFSEGKCAVLVKRNWGFIDHQGALVIPADFDAVGAFHDGVADVVYRDINLYINTRGEILPKLSK